MISGYNWQTDEFTLVHWGNTHVVDATTLFNATHKLVDTRHQEFYTKNPAYQQSKKWDEKKYLPTTGKSYRVNATRLNQHLHTKKLTENY